MHLAMLPLLAPDALEQILDRVAGVCPRPSDPLEVAAVLESLGYTDSVIRELTSHPDSRSLGRVLFDVLREHAPEPAAAPPPASSRRQDVRALLQTFSLSSIYALPWVITFAVQRWRPDALQVPQAVAAPLALALMFSLIVSGGFVQCLARKGTFYIGLGQPALGAEVSLRIWRCGVAALAATATLALAAAWYFDLFELRYAAAGAAAYVLLGVLWLTFGVLWLERRYWQVPVAFAAAALAFAGVRGAGGGPVWSQFAAVTAALAVGLALMAHSIHRHRRRAGRRLALPRFAVLARALAPYFCYGVGYFAFVFADRMAVGTAVPTAAGVEFSVDARYQAGMDVALLCFLVSMAAVEFLNYRFVHFWQREAARWTPSRGHGFRARVRQGCGRSRSLVAISFLGSVLLVSMLPASLHALADPIAIGAMALGLLGYLLLELALFNALVLFSVNDPVPVLRALAIGFAVNAIGGYVLSNAFGPMLAAWAMAAGAAVFFWCSDRALAAAMARPGYGYYVA